MRQRSRKPAVRGGFLLAVAVIALATLTGLVLLWPTERADSTLSEGLGGKTEGAEVLAIAAYPCSGLGDECRRVKVRIASGSNAGLETTIKLGVGGPNPDLDVGDQVRVARDVPIPGAEAPFYTFVDFERRAPMLWLAIAFGGLVVLFGRLRGALSLVGLLLSLAVIVAFVLPAVLLGKSPLAVAVVGAMAIMLVTITLSHGLGPKGLAALLGTAASLLLTVGLAVAFTSLTSLTGLASEEANLLTVNESGVSLKGLLLAGMVIGALGVLDDVTVSQASTVLALRAANPSQRFGELFRRALEVGRDHVSATVNTLVLAYVGASLPALLIFASTELDLFETLNSEVVAQEVVATLVGSIGLTAAVPITTALAVVFALRLEPDELATEHAHVH